MIIIARERTIVKLAITEISKFLDYLIYTLRRGNHTLEGDLRRRIRISNVLVLAYKYLVDFPQITFLTMDISQYILRKQVSRSVAKKTSDLLEGAWCEIEIESIESEDQIRFNRDFYVGVIYQTARALEALGKARGMSMVPLIKGFEFLSRVLEILDIEHIETKMLVPIMDAICSCVDAVSYDYKQKLLVPLAHKLKSMAIEIDPKLREIYTQDIFLKAKIIDREGLKQEDLKIISQNLESKILKYVLKSIEWLIEFGVSVPPRLYELLMDLLTNNFVAVFDVHKDVDLVYFISNTGSLVNIVHRLSDKKFAQLILDQTTEYISDTLLPGVDNVYSATKLLLMTKVLIDSRAVIRR